MLYETISAWRAKAQLTNDAVISSRRSGEVLLAAELRKHSRMSPEEARHIAAHDGWNNPTLAVRRIRNNYGQ